MQSLIDPRQTRFLSEALDSEGRLRVMPADFYKATTRAERALLGHKLGAYLLPTVELVEWLRDRIAGRTAIEVASGNGVLADALGIPGTDNHLQNRPEVAAIYDATRQPRTPYGPNVKDYDAFDAIGYFRPQVVVASWLTHKYDAAKHEHGGSVFGPDMQRLALLPDEFIFIGNSAVHRLNPLFEELFACLHCSHIEDSPPWLYSRSNQPSREFIACFGK